MEDGSSSLSGLFYKYSYVTIAGERVAKFKLMLGAYGYCAGRDFYRAIVAMTIEPRFLRSHPKAFISQGYRGPILSGSRLLNDVSLLRFIKLNFI